jgi:DNA-binding response OmpR family regulator
MPHVLIVEDEPAIAESLSYALRRDGFAVSVADTIGQALTQIAAADLVVLDLMLPDGSGFEIIGAVRRAEHSPPIIVLSSRDGEADRVAALETGADDYVTKPFSPREMVARVRAVLRRATSPKSGGDVATTSAEGGALSLTLDDETRRAECEGRELDLTRVEFDLLACFMAAPGRVFTRAQLIDRVWGDGFAITDRTIDSHVKGLRRKLSDAGGDAGLVETVRGVGYRLSDRPRGGGST